MSQMTDILTTRFGVDAEALSAAERLKGEKGGHLGEILVQQKAISEAQLLEALSAQSVFAADVDGDGDLDALSASYSDDKIAWYPNLGTGVFDDGFDSDANSACWSSAVP